MRRGYRRATVVAGVAAAALLHAFSPAGPHPWHWLHLVAGRLYYLPIVLAAAWFGVRATAGVTVVVSALSAAHVARDWVGLPMVQAEELAEIATFWLVGLVSASLFRRERQASEVTRVAHEETLAALAGSLELRERYTGGLSLRGASELIRAHHERYDGSGYPRGLAGAAIPLAARIFAVGDAFDALTTDRPYHAARSWMEAAQEIARGRRTQFDPQVVDAFQAVPYEDWARVAIRTGTVVRLKPIEMPETEALAGAVSGSGDDRTADRRR